MKLVTANIKSNPKMSQNRVLHDCNLVGTLGHVILWQEIAPDRYKDAVSRISGPWVHVFINRTTPISYRKDLWEEVGIQEAVKCHSGRARVTPSRYVTLVGLRRRHATYPPVIFMNTHMINGAFNNRYPLTKAWRRARWNEHFKLQRILTENYHQKGFTILGGGDMNRVNMPKYMEEQRWLAKGGIDHIYGVEHRSGAQISLRESWSVRKVYTDHAPRVSEIKLTR